MKFLKSDLINQISDTYNITKKDSSKSVNMVIQCIQKIIENGDSVCIQGFGKFDTKKMAKKKGRNPKTGETIEIKSYYNPTFKAGKTFKKSVQSKLHI